MFSKFQQFYNSFIHHRHEQTSFRPSLSSISLFRILSLFSSSFIETSSNNISSISISVIMDKICETDPYYTEMKRIKKEENMRMLIADGCDGIPPSRCLCGARIIKETSQTEADKGKKYFTCTAFENDGLHIRKSVELAIQEEVYKLRSEFGPLP